METIRFYVLLIPIFFIMELVYCQNNELKSDVIIKNDGSTILCKISKVTDTNIEIVPKTGKPFLIIDRNEVESILYSDGTLVRFDQSSSNQEFVQEIQINGQSKSKEGEDVPIAEKISNTFIDNRDGKAYKWVEIENKKWMAENLAYKTKNGSWIYKNDQSNLIEFGRLYNWETAKDVCPVGWHLPSEMEWRSLAIYLDGESFAGGKMKSVYGWKTPNKNATNESAFSALPGGCRSGIGLYYSIDEAGMWWSSTEDYLSHLYAIAVAMYYNGEFVNITKDIKVSGFSVRCVKDE